MEQDLKPNLDNIIDEYRSMTLIHLHRELLIQYERTVLTHLGLNLNQCNPEHLVDRYCQLLGYSDSMSVRNNALKIFIFQYVDENMLDYPISQIAAASVILSVNIFKMKIKLNKIRKEELWLLNQRCDDFDDDSEEEEFFEEAASRKSRQTMYCLNTDIWNKLDICQHTKYSIEDLKWPLMSVCQNL